MRPRTLYGIMAAGGAIGMVASFLQTLEKLTLIKDPDSSLYCNLNSVFSCSNVLNSSQASVFGFPNSIMSLLLFTAFFSIALAGLSGALGRKLRLSIQFLALFTLSFGLWFLWQSTYNIGSLCIFCIFNLIGLLMINWGWLRINASDYPVSKKTSEKLRNAIEHGADTFGWLLIGLLVGLLMFLRFA